MLHRWIPVIWLVSAACLAQETRQATGVKVGEVSETSAIVWMRVTAKTARNPTGFIRTEQPVLPIPPDVKVEDLESACPGAPGRVRLRYGVRQDLRGARDTGWVDVEARSDFTHQFQLSGLRPATAYYYSAETAGPAGSPNHGALRGSFTTAPPPDQYEDVTFTVITGQKYREPEDPDGFYIYDAMAKLKSKFIVPTGDTVYYDSDNPLATTIDVARYHWHRMYAYPRHIAFHLRVPGYWEKDDHDTIHDDCWPAMRPKKMLPMTFEDGQRVFLEQTPMGDKTYRTYRWGKGLQVWLVEGRDFRSPNTMADGPGKTIWGTEQKRWLKETILTSDADWKVLISPTPIVGPDRTNKADNHANKAFAHEGNEFRRWVQQNTPKNFFVACGDRHWQYHSVHPETGVEEFSCGPAADVHAGGSPGEEPAYHRFHRVKGGFLSVNARRTENESTVAFRFHDVRGNVVYEQKRSRTLR